MVKIARRTKIAITVSSHINLGAYALDITQPKVMSVSSSNTRETKGSLFKIDMGCSHYKDRLSLQNYLKDKKA